MGMDFCVFKAQILVWMRESFECYCQVKESLLDLSTMKKKS
jgi:hypothetical protein